MTIEQRQKIERKIAKAAVTQLLANGFTLSIDNGDGDEIKPAQTVSSILKEMFATDEESLYATKAIDGKQKTAMVFFVYGNDGFDVICDYSMSLEPYLTEAQALASKQEDQYS